VIHLSLPGGLLAAGAALLAGAVNAVAGGGTLVSFPCLLLLGLAPLPANVTNTVALLPGYAGGSAGYRLELRGQAGRMLSLGLAGGIGGLAGALLLLHTPPAAFTAVVPWLLLAACILLLVQPLAARFAAESPKRPPRLAPPALLGQIAAGAYGGYFGAGLGVMLLAVTGLFLRDHLQRLNALKGVLSLIINAVAAVVFALLGPVSWAAVLVMAPASLAGGFAGVVLARRLHADTLRLVVAALGVAVALKLLL